MKWSELEKYPNTWKWVLLVSGTLYVLTVISSAIDRDFDIGIIITGLNVVALYGLAYEKAIWQHKFWKGFFWFLAILSALIAIVFLAQIGSTTETGENFYISVFSKGWNSLFLLLMLVLFAVEIRAVYLYAYMKEQLWLQKKSNA